MRIAVAIVVFVAAAAAQDRFPSTIPATAGSERYVRAMYRRGEDRTILRGHVKVLGRDEGGNETAGLLKVEKCVRVVDGAEKELVRAGEVLLVKRSNGKNFFYLESGEPLGKDELRYVSLVSGLRGGADDLDFWDGEKVNEARLRKVIANADFDMAAVESQTRVVDGQFIGRLAIAKMVGKPNGTFKDGTFDVECRWRIDDKGLERFRHTHWVLRERGESAKPREVEIIGIEAHTAAAADAVFEEWMKTDAR